jgi:streptogramin lyase
LRRIIDHPSTRVVLLLLAGAQAMAGAFIVGLAVNIGTSSVQGSPPAVLPGDLGPIPLFGAPVSGVFSTPEAIVLTADGHLWYTDSNPSISRVVAPDTVSHYPIAGLGVPAALAPRIGGGVWYADPSGSAIGFVTPSGATGRYPMRAIASPRGLTSGPDGNVWFTVDAAGDDWIGRMTPAGEITRFLLSPLRYDPGQIVAAPDGNLWFAMAGAIGRITPRGEITEVELGSTVGRPSLTVGPDKAIWFARNTSTGGAVVGRVETGRVPKITAEYALPDGAGLRGIAAGSDGNLWVAEQTREAIARVSPGGKVTQYMLPGQYPEVMVAGRDGGLLFSFHSSGGRGGVGRIDLPRER